MRFSRNKIKTCRISGSNNNNKRDRFFVWELAYLRTWILMWNLQLCVRSKTWMRVCFPLSFSVIYFFSLRIREQTLSLVNSLKAMTTFQRKQSPYALTWILEKQTTNVMHDCTWQADMVGKFSSVVCGFWDYANLQRISRHEGQMLLCCWAARWASKNAT